MKGIAVVSKGIEDIAALEIKELIKADSEIKEGAVIFQVKKLEALCLLCYKAQSIDKLLLLLTGFDFKDKEELIKKLENGINKIKLDDWLNKKTTFRVSSKKIERLSYELSTEELNAQAGEMIINKIKKEKGYKQKVDLDNPGVIFFVYVCGGNCYLGIDFSGFDLHKRSYKIFVRPTTIRSTIAYALTRIAGFKKDKTLLDPFCSSGEIPIEAALFAVKFPVNYYNKDRFAFLKFIKFDFEKIDKQITKQKTNINGFDSLLLSITAAKKNAKIAGIEKQISFSRIDIEWLDTKSEKNSIDIIATKPPQPSNRTSQKDIEKLYNEFFYQTEFVLKKDGKIVLLSKETELLKRYAERHKFKPQSERKVWHGKEELTAAIFEKL